MKVSVLAVFAAVAGLGSALDAVLDPTSHADHDTDQHHGALEHRVLETAASSDMVSATQQPPTKRDATIVGPGEVKWTNTYPTTMVDLDAGVSRDRWYRTKTVSEHRAKRPRPNDHEAGPSNPPRALEMRAATTTVEPGQVHHVEKSAGIAADHVDRAKGTVIFFLGEAGRVVASLTGNGTAFAGQLRAAGQTAAQHACTQRVVLYAPDDQQEDAVRKYLGSGDFPHSPGVVPRIESIAPSLGPQPDRAPSHLLLWLAAGSGEVEITGRTVSGPDDEGPPDTETQIQHGEIDTTRPAMCLSPNAELRSRESPCDR
ncbi:hypothetical protein P8C59_004938 [Phyllachora maydis]|uniref:Uncharacterized protein n=1 Tax=Phyllachora maydis TaxID=1825666 RepID=A0AAD9I3G9_9PEZI|nr:hypothetical protein P8C59_004938 [Phyllachora maydis]